MYLAMDEIGFENAEKIKKIPKEADRWQFIYDTAKSYGFEGIHFTPSLYKDFSLDLANIPDFFQDFTLTFHFGGVHSLVSEADFAAIDKDLRAAFEIARKHNMHDISIHPPYIHKLTGDDKRKCHSLFRQAVEGWLEMMSGSGISLTLETHVSVEYFLFNGLAEYGSFVDSFPDLGVLIDLSHNYYDGYGEEEIISHLGNKNVKGLHISDALQNVDFAKGTHLPVGHGTIDFAKLLTAFAQIPNLYCALEIKGKNEDILKSIEVLKKC